MPCKCQCDCCCANTITPHQHAKVIHQWANGAEIQYSNMSSNGWSDCGSNQPCWHEHSKYRVKPVIDQIAVNKIVHAIDTVMRERKVTNKRIIQDRISLQACDATLAKLNDELSDLRLES